MRDQNPLSHLTAREQAKLEDFVTKDLGHAAPAAMDPRVAGPDPVVNNTKARNVADTVNQRPDDQSPSTEERVEPHPEEADALDVDMFARGNVDRVVDELKVEKAEAERRKVARAAGLPFVRLLGYPVSPDVLGLIPAATAKSAGVVAYLKAGHKVRLGITDPSNPATTALIAKLREATAFDYLVAVIGDDSYRYALKLYDELPLAQADTGKVEITKGEKKAFAAEIKNLSDLKERIGQVPTTKLIDILLTGAVKVGASDVHIEPTETNVRIRYRLDGVLQTVVELPPQVANQLLSRIKFLAKLKLDVNKLPQDGRFSLDDDDATAGKHTIDIRVATIPVQFGEAITMRLLDRESIQISIDSLGLTGDPLKAVRQAMKKPQGMILECGPTGSGKTTTLYALLSLLNDPGKKIITLEDPIEYRLEGVMQSQLQPEHGYDFGEGFRSVLRVDPDVIMVGEVRDNLTAEMATQASLTGHVVLSTLHTNDAPTAIPRLIDLGVRPFLLSNAISVIIAQRLVRKVCTHCAVEQAPDQLVRADIKKRLALVPAVHRDAVPPESDWLFLAGKGCEQCNGTGFRGRIGIFEVLTPNERLEQLALDRAPVSRIKAAAAEAGMLTMEQDGLIKALTGVTTVAEVWRVAREI